MCNMTERYFYIQSLGLKKPLSRQRNYRAIIIQLAACVISFLMLQNASNAFAGLFDRKPKALPNYFTQHQEEILASNPGDKANYAFKQIYEKCEPLALELGQTPELNDGINSAEARAISQIYNSIKDIEIPAQLFNKTDIPCGTYKVVFEWTGNGSTKTDWGGWFMSTGRSPSSGKVIKAEPVGLEEGEDSIDYSEIKKELSLGWESYSNSGDTDGMVVSLIFPKDNELRFRINNQLIGFNKSDFLSKGHISFNEKDGLGGTLIVKNAYGKLNPEVYAIRDMVLAGEGNFKFNAPLRSMISGWVTGFLKDGDNPFENYHGISELVMPILGYMKGQKWNNYERVDDWINHPNLLHTYINKNYRKITMPNSRSHCISDVFRNKEAWCGEMGKLGIALLKNDGYKGKLYWDLSWPKQSYATRAVSGHTVAAYEKDELMHIFIDWTPGGNSMYTMNKKSFKERFVLRTEGLPGW